MSPITTISLLTLALAMLSMSTRPAIARKLAYAVFIAALLGINGYIFGVESLYKVAAFTSLALHTATFLVLLSLGSLMARPAQDPAGLVYSAGAGGIAARALTLEIPVALAGLSLLIWGGLQWQWFDARFGLAMCVVLGMVASVFIGQRVAHQLDASDAAKTRAEEELVKQNQHLEQTVAERTASLQNEMQERKAAQELVVVKTRELLHPFFE